MPDALSHLVGNKSEFLLLLVAADRLIIKADS
jgi:hypothetical protein